MSSQRLHIPNSHKDDVVVVRFTFHCPMPHGEISLLPAIPVPRTSTVTINVSSYLEVKLNVSFCKINYVPNFIVYFYFIGVLPHLIFIGTEDGRKYYTNYVIMIQSPNPANHCSPPF